VNEKLGNSLAERKEEGERERERGRKRKIKYNTHIAKEGEFHLFPFV